MNGGQQRCKIPLGKNVPIWIFGTLREIFGCCICVLPHGGKTVSFFAIFVCIPWLKTSLIKLTLFKSDCHYTKWPI